MDNHKGFALIHFGIVVFIVAGAMFLGFLFSNQKINIPEQKTGIIAQDRIEITRKENLNHPLTLVAVGDVMLGRFVETIMKERGENYPFEHISEVLHDAYGVIGNLEGPISSEHVQTPIDSLKFSFAPNIVDLLVKNNFKILSLANNHTYDLGADVFEETKQYLRAASIAAPGHPYATREEYVEAVTFEDTSLVVIGFNVTNPHFPRAEAQKLLEDVRKAHQDSFLIVMPHWGNEYELAQNEYQTSFAHEWIDAGADVILGSHPHVVQGIEKYKGKIIFYSLGNFIFDQYFSPDAQKELIVRIEMNDREVIYRLLPVQSIRSEPRLMSEEQSKLWLDELSSRSGLEMRQEVQLGVLSVNKL